MKIKIVQAATDLSYIKLMERVEPIHRLHAEALDYCYEFDCTTRDIHPHWMKAHMLLKGHSEGFDRVIWMDADTLWTGRPLDVQVYGHLGATLQWHWQFEPAEHFNAGVLFANFERRETCEYIKHWQDMQYLDRATAPSFNDQQRERDCVCDQACLSSMHNDKTTFTITAIDHAYNSMIWSPTYRSKDPYINAWHGCPDRISRMHQFLDRSIARLDGSLT